MKKMTGDFKEINSKFCNVGDVSLTSTWYNVVWVGANQLFTTAVASKELTNASTGIATVGSIGVFLDAAASELAAFSITLPKDYKEGTNITPYICYTTTSSSGTAQIAMIGIGYTSMTTSPTTTVVGITTQTIEIPGSSGVLTDKTTSFTAITGTAFTAGTIIEGCIFRNATASTDTLSVDFVVKGIGFTYQVDGFGSTYATAFDK